MIDTIFAMSLTSERESGGGGHHRAATDIMCMCRVMLAVSSITTEVGDVIHK